MGTSNWQNIPYCIEAIMRIEPKRVLDIGVGFGRWGMVVREFCELWYGRVHRKDWQIQIEGVEGYAPAIEQHHHSFYNKIHIGDFRTIAPTLEGRWSLTIFGDVLEHFEKNEARQLLEWAIDHSDYVLVNIPLGEDWPQEDIYENVYERHLSIWSAEEFSAFALRRRALFHDYLHRPFGSFILSQEDPRDLSAQLFSASTSTELPEVQGQDLHFVNAQLRERVSALEYELYEIKRSRSFRVTQRVLRSRYGATLKRAAKAVLPDEGGVVRALINRDLRTLTAPLVRSASAPATSTINGTSASPTTVAPVPAPTVAPAADSLRLLLSGTHNPQSQGREVWLLLADTGQQPLELACVRRTEAWQLRPNDSTPTGDCLIGEGQGYADLDLPPGSRLMLMTHPWSGIVGILWHKHRLNLDLYSPQAGAIVVVLDQTDTPRLRHWRTKALTSERELFSLLPGFPANNKHGRPLALARREGGNFSLVERKWLEQMQQAKPAAIAVIHPDWRGVRASTVEQFQHFLLLEDNLNPERGERAARLLLETGCERIVISAFPHSYIHLVTALHQLSPQTKIFGYWLGSFLQSNEDHSWHGFRTYEQLTRAGIVYKWGFQKKGMAEVMARIGLNTGFLMGLVRRIPEGSSTPLEGGPHIGLWAVEPIWRKSPYAMLAACRMVDGAIVHGTGKDQRAIDFAELLQLHSRMRAAPIPQEQMPRMLAQMHLSLYVTLSETLGMVPLESLSVGAPCLMGPTSHLFEDDEYLRSRLVVAYPDRALVIAQYIEQALAERDQIIAAYREYAPGYNARALQSVRDFLEVDSDTPL